MLPCRDSLNSKQGPFDKIKKNREHIVLLRFMKRNEITKKNSAYILSFWGIFQAFEFSKQGYHVEDLLGYDLRKRV
jgi:hypothetical protein